MNRTTKISWKIEQGAQAKAGKLADAIVHRLGLAAHIDPLAVAKDEHPLLRAGGRDFGGSFDGKLRYHREKRCFLLMYNTRLDAGYPPGRHHPRTRFSIAHELGHYFLEHHHAYLTHGGKPHASINEFRSKLLIEREADAFAASLLLPTHLVKPLVNAGELSVPRIERIASDFHTSIVSTAIRSVQLSDYPCALAGIRDGAVAWMFPSDALIEAGIYPRKGELPRRAVKPWSEFASGGEDRSEGQGLASGWFDLYDRSDVHAAEEYVPVQSMGTLLVLITLDENDLATDDDDYGYRDE